MKTPNASLKRLSTVPTMYSAANPALNVCGGSNSTFGNMNRVVATAPAAQAAAKEVHAIPIVERNPRRVSAAAAEGGAAGALGAAGAGAMGEPVGDAVVPPGGAGGVCVSLVGSLMCEAHS